MGSPLIKRLDALYQRAQMVMAVQADHAPFVSIAPWSFIKDECIVKYYPEGHYQKPEQITTTLHDALMIAQYYYECGLYVQFTMTYSRLANKMAGINKRDEATVMQLNNLSLMENIILHEVDLGIMRGKHYQEIYRDCKKRLEAVKDLAYLEAV